MKLVLSLLLLSLASHAGIYHILNDPIDALSARYAVLTGATQRIYSSKFIFHADDTGLASLALIRAQARKMVNPDIRLIFDGGGPKFGTNVPPEILLHLEDEGIQIKFFNNLMDKKNIAKNILKGRLKDGIINRMHDKLFIVDSEYLLTGGRNIESTYFSIVKEGTYVDRDVLVTGPAVSKAQEHFLKYWDSPITTKAAYSTMTTLHCWNEYKITSLKACKKKMKIKGKYLLDVKEKLIKGYMKDFKISGKYKEGILLEKKYNDDIEVEFISDTLEEDGLTYKSQVGPRVLEILKNAKSHIVIESPYLIATDNFSKAVDNLLKKGVEIKILTNSLSSIDGLEVFAGYAKHRARLMKLGTPKNRLKIYEYYGAHLGSPHGKTIHSKSVSIDDEYAIIGSYNLDKLSEFHNSEVGVIALSCDKSVELREYIEERSQFTYQVGDDGIPCPPGVCKVNEKGEFVGGTIAHPFASKEKLEKLEDKLFWITLPVIGNKIERIL